jgi:glycosyltransferase involved in cell wall biosynthesis
MLGTSFHTRGGISAVIDVYRSQGLFERWPIEYIATHCDGTGARKLAVAAWAMLRFAVSLARDRHAVVHVHGASRASFWRKAAFMSVALCAGCPMIFHLHGGGFARFYGQECGPLRKRIVRFFLERAARVIVLSEQWRAWMTQTMRARVVCVPNPMMQCPEPAAPEAREGVLFLGRLEREKGIFELLDAMAALLPEHPALRLVCAGEGDAAGVARYANERGVAHAVELAGWVGPEKKRALLARAAVFALPSHAEGMPVSLLEAMAAGLPTIASSVGGIPDVIADGVNGMLVPPRDSATLARVLRRLLADPASRRRMGAAARETIGLRFDADRVIARLEDVYAGLGLVGAGKPRSRQTRYRLREAA